MVPGDGDFGVGVLHDPFDGAAGFADDAPDQVVVRQNLQRHLAAKNPTNDSSVRSKEEKNNR